MRKNSGPRHMFHSIGGAHNVRDFLLRSMSAFGGNVDRRSTSTMSAIDPKRTSSDYSFLWESNSHTSAKSNVGGTLGGLAMERRKFIALLGSAVVVGAL